MERGSLPTAHHLKDSEGGSSTHLSPTETNIASGDGGPPPPKTKRTSAVWDSFTVSENDPSKAICKLCKSKLSRDNAANMVKALTEYGHIRCMSHTLHLVVIKALEKDRVVTSLLSKARIISGHVHRSSKASNMSCKHS
ncbi:unnamed protein product [Pleuronectes platessa]|uniref:BED-type domain-containing protein n=1 Tax=Pleuronectes platessa TaxID=8262 RepID=A0A9N7W1E0_PLEPL|nr:unnamed protein product [Pleuronectes platessa]